MWSKRDSQTGGIARPRSRPLGVAPRRARTVGTGLLAADDQPRAFQHLDVLRDRRKRHLERLGQCVVQEKPLSAPRRRPLSTARCAGRAFGRERPPASRPWNCSCASQAANSTSRSKPRCNRPLPERVVQPPGTVVAPGEVVGHQRVTPLRSVATVVTSSVRSSVTEAMELLRVAIRVLACREEHPQRIGGRLGHVIRGRVSRFSVTSSAKRRNRPRSAGSRRS